MKYGCVPIVSEYCVQEPFTAKNFLVVKEKPDIVKNLIQTVNEQLNYREQIDMVKKNQQILLEHFECSKIAQQYLDLLNGKYDKPYVSLNKQRHAQQSLESYL